MTGSFFFSASAGVTLTDVRGVMISVSPMAGSKGLIAGEVTIEGMAVDVMGEVEAEKDWKL